MLKASRIAFLNAASYAIPERAVLRPADGGWSVIEVLAHLVDTDYHYGLHALAMRDEPDHMLVHFDDEAWKAEHTAILEMPFDDIQALLAESHALVLHDLSSMTDDDLDTPGAHPRGIPY